MTATIPRILFAEDNPHDIEMTLETFAEHHVANEVVVVSDGAEALDYLYARGRYTGHGAGDPALVLLDLKMPRVDGLEVLRTIKRDERLQAIPVVMLTSSREEQDLVRSYRLGVNAYVVKPVSVPDFIEAVKNLGVFWSIHNARPLSPGAAEPATPTPARA